MFQKGFKNKSHTQMKQTEQHRLRFFKKLSTREAKGKHFELIYSNSTQVSAILIDDL